MVLIVVSIHALRFFQCCLDRREEGGPDGESEQWSVPGPALSQSGASQHGHSGQRGEREESPDSQCISFDSAVHQTV